MKTTIGEALQHAIAAQVAIVAGLNATEEYSAALLAQNAAVALNAVENECAQLGLLDTPLTYDDPPPHE